MLAFQNCAWGKWEGMFDGRVVPKHYVQTGNHEARRKMATSEHHLKLSESRGRDAGCSVGWDRLIEEVLIQLRLRSGGRTCQKEGTTMLTYCQK